MIEERKYTVKCNELLSGTVSELTARLNGLISSAENVFILEELLNNALVGAYQSLPDGKENYGFKGELGMVCFCGFGSHNKEGVMNIMYSPSESVYRKYRYVSKCIGKINLRDKTYKPDWGKSYDEDFHQIPLRVMQDTESVMEGILKLKKV